MVERRRVWTVANIVTLLRLILALPAGYLILLGGGGANFTALAVFLIAALSDGLDGYLARSRKEISTLGQLLDPVADKVLGIAVFGALVLRDALPSWAFWVLVAKEALLLLGGWIVLRSRDRVVPARFFGKLTTIVLFSGIALVLVGSETPGRSIVMCGVALSVTAGIDYAVHALRPRT